MTTRVMLIRHGESTWNEAGRWQGQQDPPLTARGESQAAAAATQLGGFEGVFASSLERAERTASIIAEAMGIGPVVVLDRLMERCAGEWEGCTRAEIEAQWPGCMENGERPSGFESEESLAERGISALNEIAEMIGEGEVVAVSHSGLIYAMERSLGSYRGRLPNLSGVWLNRDTDGNWTIGERLDLLSALTTNDIE